MSSEVSEEPIAPSKVIVRSPLVLSMLAPGDGVFLPVIKDLRPLRGLAGLVDWRLHGQLTRLLVSGSFVGEKGDVCLVPSQGYVAAQHLLLFGLGSKKEITGVTVREDIQAGSKVLSDVGRRVQVFPVCDVLEDFATPEEWAETFLSLLGPADEGPHTVKILGGGTFAKSVKGVIESLGAKAVVDGRLVIY